MNDEAYASPNPRPSKSLQALLANRRRVEQNGMVKNTGYVARRTCPPDGKTTVERTTDVD